MADVPGRLFQVEGWEPESAQALAALPQRWHVTTFVFFFVPFVVKGFPIFSDPRSSA